MRIIAGTLRGRVLNPPQRDGLRPTSGRVREAMFSVLDSLGAVSGVGVLDLYAGTGCLGFEALSRGAERALFVESDKDTAKWLQQAAQGLKVADVCEIVCCDVASSVKGPELRDSSPYGLIFMDPPYNEHPGLDLAMALHENHLVQPGSVLVMESATRDNIGLENRGPWELIKDKVYGDTRLSFYQFS